MSVTILTQVQKEKAAAMFNEDGFTLTQIGTHFGVSRKTIRRVVDEINGRDEKVVEPVPELQDDEVLVKIKKGATPYAYAPTMNFDAILVAKSLADGGYFIQGQQIVDAGGKYFEEDHNFFFTAKALEFVEQEQVVTDEIEAGDIVTLAETSRFWNEGEDTSNPMGIAGKVEHLSGVILPVHVEWFNGQKNGYDFEDLILVAKASEPELEIEVELEPEDNADYFFSATQDSISMVRVDGSEVETRNINKSSGQFTELRNMLVEDTSNETLKYVFTMMDTRSVIEAFSVGRVKVDADSETVVFVKPDGTERRVPEELAMDIIDTVKTYGQSRSEHLVKFLDKLMDNPSFQAIEGLYRFMKHNCIDINEDGSIQAWKGVRNDLYDKRSGTIYNGNFGQEIRVDRSEVDDNVDHTCSYGLHVGNREYATMWGEALLRTKVEPQDVVAVPRDYNGAKMRACAYTPLEVVAK